MKVPEIGHFEGSKKSQNGLKKGRKSDKFRVNFLIFFDFLSLFTDGFLFGGI
ncbi:MAG: hypothetical protein AB7D20_06795 [Sulfuricurvum sp.]|uniref:hypothetical protein n=1 Tax=Sulfuricurvum sp. TaxID=2025608 RepID=UPI003D10211B